VIDQAIELARTTLRGNLHRASVPGFAEEHEMLLAGGGKFDALWTRDACFGGLGLVRIGLAGALEPSLRVLLQNQAPDGRVPRRIGRGSVEWVALRYSLGLGRSRPTRFDETDRSTRGGFAASASAAPDASLLVLWLASEVVEASSNPGFAEWAWPRLELAHGWVRRQVHDGLLVQRPRSDWKDTVDRGTRTTYNQALFFQALHSFARTARRMGRMEIAEGAEKLAREVARAVSASLWDETRGHLAESETRPGFSPDGNLLAVYTGLVSREQSTRIFAHCDRLLARRTLLPAAEDPFGPAAVPRVMKIAGMSGYHSTCSWPWQESLLALAACRMGDESRAKRHLETVASLAVKDGGFFEIYEDEPPVPLRRLFYKSEPRFTWSAGLFLRACSEAGLLG
jgi:glycogen debranching enzyme